MAYAQINHLSSTDGRLLEGEKRLAYWCTLVILVLSFFSVFLLFLIHSLFFSFFLNAYLCSDVVILS